MAIDANLLLLLAVGGASTKHIDQFKGLKNFSGEDFDLLVNLANDAAKIVTTPNALTELSNLSRRGMREPLKSRVQHVVRKLIEESSELYEPSRATLLDDLFARLGLADCVWLSLLRREPDLVLLTVDLDLHVAAQVRGYNSVNFNHLRRNGGLD